MKRQIAYYIDSRRKLEKELLLEAFSRDGCYVSSMREITHYLAELHGPYLVVYSPEEVCDAEKDERQRLVETMDKMSFDKERSRSSLVRRTHKKMSGLITFKKGDFS